MNFGLKILNRLTIKTLRVCNKQVRLFSSLKQKEKDLKVKLEKEIKEETESGDQEINQDFLKENGWTLEASMSTSQIKIQKDVNGKSVTVVFNARVPPMEEEQEEGEGQQ